MIRNNNKINSEIRQNIADDIVAQGVAYNGKVLQADFLARLYDLKSMPSTDYRPEYDNAYKDIKQHADRNPGDWAEDWVFTDERLNLLHCTDDEYMKFIGLTLLPLLRENDGSAERLATIYNTHLNPIGLGVNKADETKNGAPIYEVGALNLLHTKRAETVVAIKKYLDSTYVNKKIELMNKAIETDTDVAIGTGKELLETIFKSILKSRGAEADKYWTLPQLLKNTVAVLDLKQKGIEDAEQAERSVKQIFGGISSIVQGITELRNAYGSGHGKDSDFKGLDAVSARFYTGLVAEISIYLLGINGRMELDE